MNFLSNLPLHVLCEQMNFFLLACYQFKYVSQLWLFFFSNGNGPQFLAEFCARQGLCWT